MNQYLCLWVDLTSLKERLPFDYPLLTLPPPLYVFARGLGNHNIRYQKSSICTYFRVVQYR